MSKFFVIKEGTKRAAKWLDIVKDRQCVFSEEICIKNSRLEVKKWVKSMYIMEGGIERERCGKIVKGGIGGRMKNIGSSV